MLRRGGGRYKGSIQLAIVDHITSVSGIRMPVTKIANKLRPHGILVLVDGAHGPGQIEDLELAEMGVDFYVASLHKWLFAPKGTGFLWVNPIHQQYIHPLVTSHNYEMPYPDEFHSRVKQEKPRKKRCFLKTAAVEKDVLLRQHLQLL